MKRLVALLLTVLILGSLCACTFGTKPVAQTSTEATEDATPKLPEKKDFASMQKYLIDMKLLPSDENRKSKTNGEVIGVQKDGVRYILDTGDFVEFYQFETKSTPDEAQKLYDTVTGGGAYDVIGVTKLKGVVSDSGKFIMLYPENGTADYNAIAKEFKKF